MVDILDIGNTFTRIAQWDGKMIRSLHRVPTADFSGTDPGHPAVAACVRPDVKERLKDSGIKFISALNQESDVDFSAVDCRTLGADRVANAVALAALYPLPGVVIDCGTAITVEIVDAQRCFRGGAIAPGRKLMRQALHCGTGQLPEVPLTVETPAAPGCNTVDAIRFGVDCGAAGMIREYIERINKIYPLQTILLTGGDAEIFKSEIPGALIAGDEFTLTGIRIAGGY